MKQHITIEQLNELNDKKKNKLVEWALDKGYTEWTNECNDEECNCAYIKDPLLSIGQMIEFLDENNKDYLMEIISFPEESDFRLVEMQAPTAKELCDALWQAVKEVLEEK